MKVEEIRYVNVVVSQTDSYRINFRNFFLMKQSIVWFFCGSWALYMVKMHGVNGDIIFIMKYLTLETPGSFAAEFC